MNAISEAIEKLQDAVIILDEHAKNPQNYNAYYAYDFEMIGWELSKYINDIKYISNRYGVL